MYYLQSRYYDPAIGRFINADAYASTGQGILGNNMFAYCGNNPVKYSDNSGTLRQPCTISMDSPGIGYLYDQTAEPFASKPLGKGTISKNGCGVFAVYNAMISLGDSRLFSEVYAYFVNNLSVFDGYGANGVFIGTVANFFGENGYRAFVFTSHTPDEFLENSRTADACIMLYRYQTNDGVNGHYIEYSWTGEQYIGRNTIGRMESFISPLAYGYRDSRYFVYGIFIFEN